MKPAEAAKKIDTTDPIVAYIIAHPSQTVVLTNDQAGRDDEMQKGIFLAWLRYLADIGNTHKARAWIWMRMGNAKALTLPCADPAVFDRGWRPSRGAFNPVPRRMTLVSNEKQNWTFEDMADWSCVINGFGTHYVERVSRDGHPLQIPAAYPGGGKPTFYGYLTPAEVNAVLRAERPAPIVARPYSEADA